MRGGRLALASSLLALAAPASAQAKLRCGGLVPGEGFTLTLENATPGGPVFFLMSVAGPGGTFVDAPGCGPVLLLLSEPITTLAAPHADAQGRASFTGTAPATAVGGRVVRFQALDLWACQPTNLVERRVERRAGKAIVCDPTPSTGGVLVVDLDSGSVLATLTGVGSPQTAVVAPDGKLAYFTDAASHVWVVDLEAHPPALAPGTNPITVDTTGTDLVLSVDGRFLLATGTRRLVAIDAATRSVTDTFVPPLVSASCSGVDVGSDGSVVVGGSGPLLNGILYGLELDGSGGLTTTGHRELDFRTLLLADREIDVAPDGRTLVAIRDDVGSYALPTLARLDDVTLSGTSGCFDASGGRYFIRSGGAVAVFAYDPETGDSTFSFFFPAPPPWPSSPFPAPLGVAEELAFDDVEELLWMTTGSELHAYDAASGTLERTIPGVPGRGIALVPAPLEKTARRTRPALPGPTLVR